MKKIWSLLLLANVVCFFYSEASLAATNIQFQPIHQQIQHLGLSLLHFLVNSFPAITGYFNGLTINEACSEAYKIIEYCLYKQSVIDGHIHASFSGSEQDVDAIETLFTLYPDLMNRVLDFWSS